MYMEYFITLNNIHGGTGSAAGPVFLTSLRPLGFACSKNSNMMT